MCVSSSRGFVNLLLRRMQPAEQDVIKDRVVKQKGLLGDKSDLFAQRFLRDASADLDRRSLPLRKSDRYNRRISERMVLLPAPLAPDEREAFSLVRCAGSRPLGHPCDVVCVAEM